MFTEIPVLSISKRPIMAYKSMVVCRRSARNGTHTSVTMCSCQEHTLKFLNSTEFEHWIHPEWASYSETTTVVLLLVPPSVAGVPPLSSWTCGLSGWEGTCGTNLEPPRAGQLPPRGREKSEEWGGAQNFTGLNPLCPTPGWGWEKQPPVAQKLRFGCCTRVSAWHSEEKYWSLDSVLPCSF